MRFGAEAGCAPTLLRQWSYGSCHCGRRDGAERCFDCLQNVRRYTSLPKRERRHGGILRFCIAHDVPHPEYWPAATAWPHPRRRQRNPVSCHADVGRCNAEAAASMRGAAMRRAGRRRRLLRAASTAFPRAASQASRGASPVHATTRRGPADVARAVLVSGVRACGTPAAAHVTRVWRVRWQLDH